MIGPRKKLGLVIREFRDHTANALVSFLSAPNRSKKGDLRPSIEEGLAHGMAGNCTL